MTAKQMLGECINTSLDKEDARIFTPDEFASAISETLRVSRWIKTGLIKPDAGTPKPEDLKELVSALEECRMRQNVRQSKALAMLSCNSLMEEMWRVDKEGELLFKRGSIFRRDWVIALEQLLPAAQMCRNQLGNCYNPAQGSQKRVMDILMSFSILLYNASDGKTNLNYKIAPCTPTYLVGDDVPDPKKKELIEYLNTTVDDEFVSVGGETRAPPKVEVQESAP